MIEEAMNIRRGEEEKLNTIRRTLRIVETVCREKSGLTVSELAKKHNISAPLMHSYIRSILKEGYIFKDKESGRIRATYKIVEIGSHVVSNNEVTEITHSTLSDLCRELQSAVHLALREDDLGVCVDKVGHSEAIPSITRVGMSFDLYATALGKAMLAYMNKEEISEYLSRVELIPYTQNTIVEKGRLLRELEIVRKNGYAIDNEEHRMDLRGMGVPIFDYSKKPIGAISILLPFSADKSLIAKLFKKMRAAAEEISRKLGCGNYGEVVGEIADSKIDAGLDQGMAQNP